MSADALFAPFAFKGLHLKNRIVMAPMTRSFSPDGTPGQNVADYYRARAQGDVGLILSEGTVVARPAAKNDPNVPFFHGEAALPRPDQRRRLGEEGSRGAVGRAEGLQPRGSGGAGLGGADPDVSARPGECRDPGATAGPAFGVQDREFRLPRSRIRVPAFAGMSGQVSRRSA